MLPRLFPSGPAFSRVILGIAVGTLWQPILPGAAFGQTTYWVNGLTGNTCHDGLAPVPSDLCIPGSPPPTIPGPFKTITAAVQAAATPANGIPVTILVAGVTSGGSPVVYNAALGEVFPLSVPRETMIRYDAANSTPGTLVTVDAAGTGATRVFEFLASPGNTFSSAGGLDGSTLGAGTQAIRIRGADQGVRIAATLGAANSITVRNVRIWNNFFQGAHVVADQGNSMNMTLANPTFDSCLFTQETSVGVVLADHLLLESGTESLVTPIVFNCLFRVEPDAFGISPRVERGIRMITNGLGTTRVAGTFIAVTIDGFSNVCVSGTACTPGCTQQGIDFGVFAAVAVNQSLPSEPTFTTCDFQNCGVTGFFATTGTTFGVSTGPNTFNPKFSNCNFLYNGKRWPCVDIGGPGDPDLNSLRGHGFGFRMLGGTSEPDLQYCLSAGNYRGGFYSRVVTPVVGGWAPPLQRIRFLKSRSSNNG
ncbi:MAG: hypothetical protein L0323_22990, partial [Planctomycetes bacterium]|nr:hypothetical protein [Planctomycetota bacterium]